jgi:hypothetical protein
MMRTIKQSIPDKYTPSCRHEIRSELRLADESALEIAAQPPERLLTIEELAERLQYSVGWFRQQVKFGRILVIAFNRRAWRFHWPTVIATLQKI